MSFVDLHIHGAFGVDFTTAPIPELERAAAALGARGYRAFLPTLVPMAREALEPCVERLATWIAARKEGDGLGARPLGVHFEGPFVAPGRAGALHPSAFRDARDAEDVRAFLASIDALPGRHVVTLAPEIPGGIELVKELRQRDVVVAIGHTDATYAEMDEACAAGASHLTHFCNAMRPLHHREPGPIGFGLLRQDVTLDVIADGHHVHPRMLELILRVRGPERVALISDAAPPAGLPDGEYEAWGERLVVTGGAVRNAKGGLAGAARLLDEGVRAIEEAGVEERRARAMAETVPLAILGL